MKKKEQTLFVAPKTMEDLEQLEIDFAACETALGKAETRVAILKTQLTAALEAHADISLNCQQLTDERDEAKAGLDHVLSDLAWAKGPYRVALIWYSQDLVHLAVNTPNGRIAVSAPDLISVIHEARKARHHGHQLTATWLSISEDQETKEAA